MVQSINDGDRRQSTVAHLFDAHGGLVVGVAGDVSQLILAFSAVDLIVRIKSMGTLDCINNAWVFHFDAGGRLEVNVSTTQHFH